MAAIPLNYPDNLWYYNDRKEKTCPSWAEIYYCARYNVFLYVFVNKYIDSLFDVINIDELKKSFLLNKNADSIEQCQLDWHSFFIEHMTNLKRHTCDEFSIAIPAKCLMLCEGAYQYQIVIPELPELLFEIIDGNLSFEPPFESSCSDEFFSQKIDSLAEKYTKGHYSTIRDFYMHENQTEAYFDFLREINEMRISDFETVSRDLTKCCVIDLGMPIMPFPFGGIGFTDEQKRDVLYYDPMYNIFIYRSQIPQYRRLEWYVKLEYQLIEIPMFASPYKILTENKLKTHLDHDAEKMDKMYESYDLSIYPDAFQREYGYRTSFEMKLIYKSICKYKHMEYDWFRKHGIRILLSDSDRKDIMYR